MDFRFLCFGVFESVVKDIICFGEEVINGLGIV